LELLLVSLRSATAEEAAHIRNELALEVRGIVVRQAEAVAARHPTVELGDLVQEGILGVLPYLTAFRPGRAPGKSLLPGYVATIARQRMNAHALEHVSPVRLTSAARRRERKATRASRETGASLAECLVAEGLAASHFMPAVPLEAAASVRVHLDETLSAQEEADELAEALAELSEAEREVIGMLFGLEGSEPIGPRAVAEALRVPMSEVTATRDRALEKLREVLG
jgi:RNA polymerase sigma factor (sigma-70 family)